MYGGADNKWVNRYQVIAGVLRSQKLIKIQGNGKASDGRGRRASRGTRFGDKIKPGGFRVRSQTSMRLT